MSYTLLDYVQTILSSLDSDEVNSYNESVESLQVANIVKTCYNDLMARADLPEHYNMFELDGLGDTTKPVVMERPTQVLSLLWLDYNTIADGETDPNWKRLTFKPIDEFLKMQYNLNLDDDSVEEFNLTVGAAAINFLYRTDKAPQYYTTADDSVIVFDSLDTAVDTTLQGSKTQAYGKINQTFTMSDSFVPFFDPDVATLLLNESKILAFAELKQIGHDVAKQWSNRGWTKLQKAKRGINQDRNELDRAPNYGRNSWR